MLRRFTRLESFLFCMSLDLGTKIIACVHSLLFVFLVAAPVVESFLAGRFYADGFLVEISFTSYGIFSMTLLYGTMKANPIHMAPWVLLNSLFLSMLFILFAVTFVTSTVYSGFSPRRVTALAVILIVHSYCVAVVTSNYLRLKERTGPSQPIRESSA